MSLFHSILVECPSCEEFVTVSAVGSVNADRRPDYRDDILNDVFQDTTCGSCNKSFRLQPEFNYLDAGRGQWIGALPGPDFGRYLELEDEVTSLFAQSYGDKSPEAAQVIGKKLSVRMTFGWPALREKIFAREHDLDDVVLELLKLDLLRRLPSAPLAPGVELRLADMGETEMLLVWLETVSETPIEELTIPRRWYDAIADDLTPWQAVASKLTDGPFVDMQKLYMGEGRRAAE